jgi:hypothetical protein
MANSRCIYKQQEGNNFLKLFCDDYIKGGWSIYLVDSDGKEKFECDYHHYPDVEQDMEYYKRRGKTPVIKEGEMDYRYISKGHLQNYIGWYICRSLKDLDEDDFDVVLEYNEDYSDVEITFISKVKTRKRQKTLDAAIEEFAKKYNLIS